MFRVAALVAIGLVLVFSMLALLIFSAHGEAERRGSATGRRRAIMAGVGLVLVYVLLWVVAYPGVLPP